MAIPKQSFIAWLAIRDCLSTGERMQKLGYQGEVLRVFCRKCIEGKAHLFFFSKRIWQEVLRSCLLEEDCADWDDVLLMGLRVG